MAAGLALLTNADVMSRTPALNGRWCRAVTFLIWIPLALIRLKGVARRLGDQLGGSLEWKEPLVVGEAVEIFPFIGLSERGDPLVDNWCVLLFNGNW